MIRLTEGAFLVEAREIAAQIAEDDGAPEVAEDIRVGRFDNAADVLCAATGMARGFALAQRQPGDTVPRVDFDLAPILVLAGGVLLMLATTIVVAIRLMELLA